jgi:hypothetical protein
MANQIVLPYGDRHNICAYLDPTTKYGQDFRGIIEFLRRSRILHAISVHCDIYSSHIQEFWNTAQSVIVDGISVLQATVLGHPITVGEADIRRVLRFGGEPEGLTNFSEECIKGCFLRGKYFGIYNAKSIKKGKLPLQYKYLAHVLLHCLGMRRGTFDELRDVMRSAMVALILNKPFNFSGMIFKFMKDNVSSKDKFLLYPRFIQMLVDERYPGDALARVAGDRLKIKHMNDQGLSQVKAYQRTTEAIPEKGLVGHLARANYVAPEGDDWRHADSDSDAEDVDGGQQPPPPPPPPPHSPEVAPFVDQPIASEAPEAGQQVSFESVTPFALPLFVMVLIVRLLFTGF